MKKILITLTTLLSFSLLGCNYNAHEHTFNDSWSMDDCSHWHDASCEHTDLISSKAPHDFGTDNVCDICGYILSSPAHEHSYDLDCWVMTNTHHWHESNCEHTGLAIDVGEHTYNDAGVCTVCGHQKEAELYKFSFKSDYCTLDNQDYYQEGEAVELSLSLNEEFKISLTLPNDIEIYSNNELLTKGSDYTFVVEGDVGTLSLTINGNIVVKVFRSSDQNKYKVNEEEFNQAMNINSLDYVQCEINYSYYSTYTILMNAVQFEYSPTVAYLGTYSLSTSRYSGTFVCDYSYIEKVDDQYTKYSSSNSGVWERSESDEESFNRNKYIDLTHLPFVSSSGFTLDYNTIKDCFNETINAYEVIQTLNDYDIRFEISFLEGKIQNILYEANNQYQTGYLVQTSIKYAQKTIIIPEEARPKYYTVIWKNYDGEVLEIDYQVEEGTIPTCEVTPVKEHENYVYNFVGWDKEITPITENTIYVAQFERDVNKHLVVFKDNRGKEISRQFVTTGETPDLTAFKYDWLVEEDYVYSFKGWDKPIGNIYEQTTITGDYQEYQRVYTPNEINSMISPTGLGDNFSFYTCLYQDNLLMTTEHISVANGKYKNIVEYGVDNPNYGKIYEVYYDSNYEYRYCGEDNARISVYSAETPLFNSELNYDLSAFRDMVDADYVFDINSETFISSGSYERVTLTFKDGMVDTMKREMNYNLSLNDPATTYDTLKITNIGGVEPFEIPNHNYQGVDKFHVVFMDNKGKVLKEQYLYEGAMPDASDIDVEDKITEDKIVKFDGWNKEFVPVSEDTIYIANFYEYKKSYTNSEIKTMLSAEALNGNVKFIKRNYENDILMSTENVTIADGKYQNICQYAPANVRNYGTIAEMYADSDYVYVYNKAIGQDAIANKMSSPGMSPYFESLLQTIIQIYDSNNDYLFNESSETFISLNDTVNIWITFKNGKIKTLNVKQLNFPYDNYVIEFLEYGTVDSFDIPSHDWVEGH